MKLMSSLAILAAALCATPAVAQNGQWFDWAAQTRAFSSERSLDDRQCFNGKSVAGVSRAGETTLYVQSREGEIYRAQLAGACEALRAAEKITLRSAGGDDVCARESAEVIIQTADGERMCRAPVLHRLTARELTALARTASR